MTKFVCSIMLKNTQEKDKIYIKSNKVYFMSAFLNTE